jgi:hypothetical protein
MLQIKFQLSLNFVEFLQLNFATSTHPFASVLRWLFSVIYCLQYLLFSGLKECVSTFHLSSRSLSLFVLSLVRSVSQQF